MYRIGLTAWRRRFRTLAMHATNLSLDIDTGTLTLRLSDGSEYLITNAFHAQVIRAKIKPGTVVTDEQMAWLVPYRVPDSDITGKTKLKTRLRKLREELNGAQCRE